MPINMELWDVQASVLLSLKMHQADQSFNVLKDIEGPLGSAFEYENFIVYPDEIAGGGMDAANQCWIDVVSLYLGACNNL